MDLQDIILVKRDIEEYSNRRRLLIYGAGNNGKKLLAGIIKDWPDAVEGFIDKSYSEDQCKGYPVYRPEILMNDDVVNKYYIVVSLGRFNTEVVKLLEIAGYRNALDYSYHPEYDHEEIVVGKGTIENYSDKFGNMIHGKVSGCEIHFLGDHGVIEIDGELEAHDVCLTVGSRSRITFGNNVSIGQPTPRVSVIGECRWSVDHDSQFCIGDNCRFFDHGVLRVGSESECFIGNNCSFEHGYLISLMANTELRVGNDLMASYNTFLFTSDGHPIFDINTGICLNAPTEIHRKTVIGDHVWLGYDSTIIGKGTIIGAGSVVGAKSFVRGQYPNNCIIAGVPAKIIKRDIAWGHSFNEGIEDISEEFVRCTVDI